MYLCFRYSGYSGGCYGDCVNISGNILTSLYVLPHCCHDDCVYVSGNLVVVMMIVFMFQVFRWLYDDCICVSGILVVV